MRAILRKSEGTQLEEVPTPVPADQEVLLRVTLAGLCRTDLAVAGGHIPVAYPRILGHEFCGRIERLGGDADGFALGQRVGVNPVIPCGSCRNCRSGSHCVQPQFLGIGVDGAFAEQVVVPRSALIPLSRHVTDAQAVFIEPLAAALAVTKAGLRPEDRCFVVGHNRIAALTARVLAAKGFQKVSCMADADHDSMMECDAVIETDGQMATFRKAMDALRPGGTLVIKSRTYAALSLFPAEISRRELRLVGVHYGSFSEAIHLLETGQVFVDDLIGTFHSLAQFPQVFAAAGCNEVRKAIFRIGSD